MKHIIEYVTWCEECQEFGFIDEDASLIVDGELITNSAGDMDIHALKHILEKCNVDFELIVKTKE